MEEEQSKSKPLHIVMFPWLAIGHLRPFFTLSKHLARKGHLISFISTPRNLQRAIIVPKELSHLINLVSIPLPRVEHLPPDAESSMDVPHVKQQLLKVALDQLEPSVRSFLEGASPRPDWIVYDYAAHWLPRLAEEYGVSRAYFSLFTTAFMAFLGPPSMLISPENQRLTAEDYTVVPKWIPFATPRMAFRLHEMTRNIEKDAEGNCYDSGTSDGLRFGLSIDGSDLVISRSSIEFEPEWFDLLAQLYQKPIISIGSLPEGEEEEENEATTYHEWSIIKHWLDAKQENSVLYVALGTESVLSQTEVSELAIGLEKCDLPFLWVLNRDHMHDMLPDGFSERVKARGMVYTKWAPQVKILGHGSIGGFLTHCGWNSVTEALGFGKALLLFPVMNDQGLNARLLQDKRVGVEIPRDERDGLFSSDEVAETVRFVMVSDGGREVRDNARRMKEVFGDVGESEGCVERLVEYMVQRRKGHNSDHGNE